MRVPRSSWECAWFCLTMHASAWECPVVFDPSPEHQEARNQKKSDDASHGTCFSKPRVPSLGEWNRSQVILLACRHQSGPPLVEDTGTDQATLLVQTGARRRGADSKSPKDSRLRTGRSWCFCVSFWNLPHGPHSAGKTKWVWEDMPTKTATKSWAKWLVTCLLLVMT